MRVLLAILHICTNPYSIWCSWVWCHVDMCNTHELIFTFFCTQRIVIHCLTLFSFENNNNNNKNRISSFIVQRINQQCRLCSNWTILGNEFIYFCESMVWTFGIDYCEFAFLEFIGLLLSGGHAFRYVMPLTFSTLNFLKRRQSPLSLKDIQNTPPFVTNRTIT